jgi:hypothetical protein
MQQGGEIASIIFNTLQVLSVEDVTLFRCVLWSIWEQGNNKVWNDMTNALAYVMERAKTMLQDWKATRLVRCLTCTTQRHVGNNKWSKPNVGRFKCNIDMSFSNKSMKL